MGKIRLGFYPYTYARVSAMKAKLIRRDDYHKLLKMKLNEVTKFLEDLEYKLEIDQLGVDYSGVELFEVALNLNLARAFTKLKRISEEELNLLIDAYLKGFDIENIKTILRGKFTNESSDKIKKLLLPIGSFDEKFLNKLLELESIEEVVKTLKISELDAAYSEFKESKNLFGIENTLDKHYYSGLIEFLKTVPKQGDLFAKFLKNEIDVLNIKTLLRLKREGLDKSEVIKYLFFSGNRLNERMLNKLAGMDINDLLAELEKRGYGKIITGAIDKFKKENTLIEIELELDKYLLTESLLLIHQHPLSIDVILGYMFAKEIEIKNLKTILKGKQLGLDEGFIEQSLVMGV